MARARAIRGIAGYHRARGLFMKGLLLPAERDAAVRWEYRDIVAGVS
jgi:hypothetical protein